MLLRVGANSVNTSGWDVRWWKDSHVIGRTVRHVHVGGVSSRLISMRLNHPSFLIAIWLTARRKMAIECRSGTIQNLSEDGRRLRVNTSREVNRSVDVRRNQESEFHLAPLQRRGFWILFSSTFSPSRVVFGQVDSMMF